MSLSRGVTRLVAVVAVVVLGAVGLVGLGTGIVRFGSSGALGPPHFVEVGAAAGLVHTYDGPYSTFVGGGVAVFDCNGDGRPDVYLSGGSAPAELYRNDSPVGGALRFTALHDPATDLVSVNGAYPLDIDGDGQVDLAVLRVGGVDLLRGLGDCRFERANKRWSFDGGHAITTAFSATWEGSNALPTIALGNYLKVDASGEPTSFCSDNSLLRPNAAGTGYTTPIVLAPGFCALSMLFSDWDRSGRRDLRVSNDSAFYDLRVGEEQLWRVSPGEPPRLYMEADGWVGMQIQGMGIASYDVTGDGYPDVFLTSQAANRLQTLAGGPGRPTYQDIGLKRGVNATHPYVGDVKLPSTAWHPDFQDVNNDGYVDLFISKGNVDAIPDYARQDPSNLLIGQSDGTFMEGAPEAGIVTFDKGRGAALADFNLDGLLDLVLVNHGAPVRLWRNVGSGSPAAPAPMGRWLALRASQPGPNLDAIGAWIEVRVGQATSRRELTIGGGHIGGQLGFVHFGVGTARDAEVRVQWPDGETGPWLPVAANAFYDLERDASAARRWQPAP